MVGLNWKVLMVKITGKNGMNLVMFEVQPQMEEMLLSLVTEAAD